MSRNEGESIICIDLCDSPIGRFRYTLTVFKVSFIFVILGELRVNHEDAIIAILNMKSYVTQQSMFMLFSSR